MGYGKDDDYDIDDEYEYDDDDDYIEYDEDDDDDESLLGPSSGVGRIGASRSSTPGESSGIRSNIRPFAGSGDSSSGNLPGGSSLRAGSGSGGTYSSGGSRDDLRDRMTRATDEKPNPARDFRPSGSSPFSSPGSGSSGSGSSSSSSSGSGSSSPFNRPSGSSSTSSTGSRSAFTGGSSGSSSSTGSRAPFTGGSSGSSSSSSSTGSRSAFTGGSSGGSSSSSSTGSSSAFTGGSRSDDKGDKGKDDKGKDEGKGGGLFSRFGGGGKSDDKSGDKGSRPSSAGKGDDKGEKKSPLGSLGGRLGMGGKSDSDDKGRAAAASKSTDADKGGRFSGLTSRIPGVGGKSADKSAGSPGARPEKPASKDGGGSGAAAAIGGVLGGIGSRFRGGGKDDSKASGSAGRPGAPGSSPGAGAGSRPGSGPGGGPGSSPSGSASGTPGRSGGFGSLGGRGNAPGGASDAVSAGATSASTASAGTAKQGASPFGQRRSGGAQAAPREGGGGGIGGMFGRLLGRGDAQSGQQRQRQQRPNRIPTTASAPEDGLTLDNWLDILGVGLVFGALVLFFSAISNEQAAISGVLELISDLFGRGALAVPITMFAIGMWLIVRHFGDEAPKIDPIRVAGIILGFIALLITLQYLDTFSYTNVTNADGSPNFTLLEARLQRSWDVDHTGGGWIGVTLYLWLVLNFTEIGGFFLLIFMFVIAGMLTTRLTLSDILRSTAGFGLTVRESLRQRADVQRAKRLEAQQRAALEARQPNITVSEPEKGALPTGAAAALPEGSTRANDLFGGRDIRFNMGGQSADLQPVAGQPMAGPGAGQVPPPMPVPKSGGILGRLLRKDNAGSGQNGQQALPQQPMPQPMQPAAQQAGTQPGYQQDYQTGYQPGYQQQVSGLSGAQPSSGAAPIPPGAGSASPTPLSPLAMTPDANGTAASMPAASMPAANTPLNPPPGQGALNPPPGQGALYPPPGQGALNPPPGEGTPLYPPPGQGAGAPPADDVGPFADRDPEEQRRDRLNAIRMGRSNVTPPGAVQRPPVDMMPPAGQTPAGQQPTGQQPAAPSKPSYSAFGKPDDIPTHPSEKLPFVGQNGQATPPSRLPSAQPSAQEAQQPQQQRLNVEPVINRPQPVSSPVVNQTRLQRASWRLPDSRTLLSSGSEQEFDREHLLRQARIIEETLESFGAPGRVVEVNTGPVITQFGVEPDYISSRGGKKQRVKVSAIAALDKDLQLALGARSIRVEAPVPGKGYVGVEVPNEESSLVSLRDVMESDAFRKIKSPLAIALGQSVSGAPVAADLTAMPHLLIAGTTGSGKSVCVNSVIASLMIRSDPETVKFIMVDPKRVELTGYNGVPHLVAPVVVELERIVGVLKWVTREMDERYRKFSESGSRNIVDYNKHRDPETVEKMPYIVVIIDELADLMMLAPEETERTITRIAALARATGIHLVIATQRPSVDVVTGLIKANFPARIAFAVAGGVDSRVILDQPGAERLLGKGDMLYMSGDSPAPLRLQGVYVSDLEIGNIVRYWKMQAVNQPTPTPITISSGVKPDTTTHEVRPRGDRVKQQAFWDASAPAEAPPARPYRDATTNFPLPEDFGDGDVDLDDNALTGDTDEDDEMYEQAVELVRRLNKASVSLLQRRLRIGYTRAARLIDVMEARGVVGPAKEGSSKPRDVLPLKSG